MELLPGLILAALIALPWLEPGYLFGTDWPGPRRFPLPSGLSSSAPLQALLAGVSWVVGPEATGKILVFALLGAAGVGASRAVPSAGLAGRVAAATLFVTNPFVFGRLHYGQLFLLAGYALLPWVSRHLWGLCAKPGRRDALWLALDLALIGMFTAHLLLVASAAVGSVALAGAVFAEDRPRYAASMAKALATTAVAAFVLSSYWVVPLLLGHGFEASVISQVGPGQLRAYAAVPDPQLGLVPNLLGLYGFWAEQTGRFTSMKEFAPLWPLVLAGVLAVSAWGAVPALRARESRAWVAGLLLAGLIALVLEVGVSHPLTAGLVGWLDSAFPVYRGMRDAGKWAALLALVYSQLFGLGVNEIVDRVTRIRPPAVGAEWIAAAAAGLLVALPLYYGNGLLFGMHGEIRPSAYPAGWYAADRVLAADPHPGRTLFLPWHEYLRLSFVRNQNSVVAAPARTFFSVPVVSSANPELPGVAPPPDPDQAAISGLVAEGAAGPWGRVLSARGIKYVLVAREVDWRSFDFLGREPGFMLVADFGSIVLYRVFQPG